MSQQMRLSPQLQQSLQILQAPIMELQQIVRQELLENPVLEAETTEISLETERPEEKMEDEFAEEFNRLSAMDDEWRNYLAQSASVSRGPRNAEEEERRQFLFDSLTTPVTLQEHLLEQLRLSEASENERGRVELLIGSLDDRGMLPTSLEELALNLAIPLPELERARDILQTFDPPGIGAHDLRECLLLQLQRQGREHSLEARIVANHLDDLARRKFAQIAKKLSVTSEMVSRAAEAIGGLNPRPAAAFTAAAPPIVTPDATVELSQGVYTVVMNEEQLPRLRISNVYKDLMAQDSKPDVREYIRQKIQNGKFFIRSVQQRQETIRKIAEEIVKRQEDFLRHGPSKLRPLKMSQVAEVVGVHETTVSRAVAGKYLATPHGVFELRSFFISGYEVGDGVQVSKTGVKMALEEIVKAEPPTAPLTDDQIQAKLAERGMKIARRTVAKYREELNILPVHLRRS